MKIKNVVVLFSLIGCLGALAADTNSYPWLLTLSGGGNTTLNSGGSTAIGLDVGVGKEGKILLPVEAGIRQGVHYVSNGDDVVFDSKLYFDVFPIKFHRFEVGAGINGGVVYGNTPIVYSVAPEGVVRLWITEKAGIFGSVDYPFDLGKQVLGDRLTYKVGLIIRF